MKKQSNNPAQKELKSPETKFEIIRSPRDRRATGPRTEQGKQRSSRNAIKHGLYSGVILLEDESKSRYQELRRALSEYWKPVGAMEEILVEEMVTILWRKRRLRKAEQADILEARESLCIINVERRALESKQAEELGEPSEGLIKHSCNPSVIVRIVPLLEELRYGIKQRGLSPEADAKILETVYGERWDEESIAELPQEYVRLTSKLKRKNLEPGSQQLVRKRRKAAKEVAKLIKAEIRNLSHTEHDDELEADRKVDRMQKRTLLPSPFWLVPWMRYEAHLNRALDRAMNQLERLQRMRLGQPVLPPVRVEVSH